jgi:hypothetical protein
LKEYSASCSVENLASEVADLKRRGADVVLRHHQCRKTDFRRGVRLGRYDHLVVWEKPARPDWMDEETYRQFPDELAMREVRIHIKGKGRKEIWAHLLANNLIRKVTAQAAQEYEVEPWTISFKATLQTPKAFALPLLTCSRNKLPEVIEELLLAIVRHSVGNRPDRVEPRALKRRPKPYALLTKPREKARKLEIQDRCA